VSEKQRLSPWEVVEGGKNPGPVAWAWYRGTKIERKPLRYQTAYRLLLYHSHSLAKAFSYYLEPLPLPPEENLEPPEKVRTIFIVFWLGLQRVKRFLNAVLMYRQEFIFIQSPGEGIITHIS
jgi:hypothetical protein